MSGSFRTLISPNPTNAGFFAVTSTASAVYLCWLCWVVGRCVFVVTQIQHVQGTTKYILPKIGGMIFVATVGLFGAAWLMLIVRFEPSRGPAGLSTVLPIGWRAQTHRLLLLS
jgi:hypothetical protein